MIRYTDKYIILENVKKELIKLIKDEVRNKNNNYLNFFDKYSNEYDYIIDNLFSNNSNINFISETKQYILKERWGINQDSQIKTLDSLSKILGVSRERVRQIFNISKKELLETIIRVNELKLLEYNFSVDTINYIFKNIKKYDDYYKVFYIEENSKEIEEIKERIKIKIKENNITSLDILLLDETTIYKLNAVNINNIKDIIRFTEKLFMNVKNIRKSVLENIVIKVKKLGFDFQKEYILNKSDSISIFKDVTNLNYKIYDKLLNYGIKNISDLLDLKTSDLIDLIGLTKREYVELIKKIKDNGFLLKNMNSDDFLIVDSNSTVDEFAFITGLSNRAYWCLKRNGLNTINDIICLTKNELKDLKSLGDTIYIEIAEKLDLLGFCCKGEIIVNTNPNEDKIRELKLKYKELLKEKQKLIIQDKELDLKLKVIMDNIKLIYKENNNEKKY